MLTKPAPTVGECWRCVQVDHPFTVRVARVTACQVQFYGLRNVGHVRKGQRRYLELAAFLRRFEPVR
jgi:hypothetical protein